MNDVASALPLTRTLKLLLVDDEPDVRRLCTDLCENAGYQVTAVESGKKGARAALSEHFDVAIIDYRLPDCRGIALVRWLKKRFPKLATIVFSAYADWDMYFRASGAGAKDVIAKTSPPNELLRTVKHAVPQ
jgi:DNA-binding NtrC family response regulator